MSGESDRKRAGNGNVLVKNIYDLMRTSRITLAVFISFFFVACLQAQTKTTAPPIITFVRANISDSAKVVKERAFDVLLKEAVNKTACLVYIDTHKRDSLAEEHAQKKEPFAFKEIASEMDAKYGAFFSLERFG